MRIINNKAYDLKPFKGFTHRYIIRIVLTNDDNLLEEHQLQVYTTNESKEEVEKLIVEAAFLKDKRVDIEKSKIVHTSTKEKDNEDKFVKNVMAAIKIRKNQ